MLIICPSFEPQLTSQRACSQPSNIQPGGGSCMALELAWGRLRRAWLRRWRPGYVARMAQRRQGECPNCPHDIVDVRDLKFVRNICGYWFRPEDDGFQWRRNVSGLARVGLAEVVIFSSLFLVRNGNRNFSRCFHSPGILDPRSRTPCHVV